MNKIAIAYLVAIGAVMAQPMNSALERPPVNIAADSGLTRDEAITLLKEAGFEQIEIVAHTPTGRWSGAAMRNGHRIEVMIDSRGNITAGK